ncbi:complex 1 protein-domain-containing protein [Macrophomina phaseolina]|uniref:LYR motif-containing protein 2 n=1 Tax=Macrophomina phaseolina TaxID=35725 RepID=A0ABQ8GKS0_9PEZI|nr:complex 1 protein-domain-containing protein [Macrophomina phaseolina]
MQPCPRGRPGQAAGESCPQLDSIMCFIQRQRVVSLWRDIVRALNKIPPSPTRDELRRYARTEFERNRNVTDITHIRYLISTGKTEFDSMKRYIEEQAR